MKLYTDEKGASMVEILGVLAVVATIATGLFTGIANINQKIKLTRAQAEISDIVKATRTQFSSFIPTSITAESLYKIGIFKNITDDNKSINVYGTEMEMVITTNVENPYFTFTYKDIPSSICTDILLGDWGNDPSSGLKDINVETKEKSFVFQWDKDIRPVDPDSTEDAPETKPLLPSLKDAIDACTRSGKGIVTISWSYYL